MKELMDAAADHISCNGVLGGGGTIALLCGTHMFALDHNYMAF